MGRFILLCLSTAWIFLASCSPPPSVHVNSDASLIELQVSIGWQEYTASIEGTVATIVGGGRPGHLRAKLDKVTLPSNASSYPAEGGLIIFIDGESHMVVTAQDGTEESYTIVITRAPYFYTDILELDLSINGIIYNIIPQDNKPTIRGLFGPEPFEVFLESIDLPTGARSIPSMNESLGLVWDEATLTVVAEDNTTTQQYQINFDNEFRYTSILNSINKLTLNLEGRDYVASIEGTSLVITGFFADSQSPEGIVKEIGLVSPLDIESAPAVGETISFDKGKANIIIESRLKKQPEVYTLSLVAPDDFVQVEGDSFIMGSETNNNGWEKQHVVTVSNFYLQKYEVTHMQYENFLNDSGVLPTGVKDGELYIELNNSGIQHDGTNFVISPSAKYHPVTGVTWIGAMAYSEWVASTEKYGTIIPGEEAFNVYGKLPTEAEWEYAARGGNKSADYIYSGSNIPGNVAWYKINRDPSTQPVGKKEPNELGFYDMSGNVWEWCSDFFEGTFYDNSPPVDPEGPLFGLERVLRGGSFSSQLEHELQVSHRNYHLPGDSQKNIGFRPTIKLRAVNTP